ncbi:MAG: beta-glucosidase [Christensenellales bacterium]
MALDIKKILSEMTLEEKASLCSGGDFWHNKPIKRLNVPEVMMADGPHGLRKEDDSQSGLALKISFPATCFPTAVTACSTWNRELIHKMGDAIAKEAKDQQLSTVLGPGTNIKRSPLCGRNFEYFSEDPYIAGEMAASYIKGVQKNGVGTSLKHYAVNNQEYLRMTVSAVVDQRTLREIYLAPFEKAVKESQPQTVMCSYNRINGVYSSDNKWLLTDVLREEWGYKGIVVSDWGATNDRVEGIKAGMDLEMPGPSSNDKKIVKAVKEGSLKEEDLDIVVERLLNYISESDANLDREYRYDYALSHELARQIAEEGAVLLKNENILPLKEKDEILVLGELARTPRYQGSGSSRINPKNLLSFIDYLDSVSAKYEFSEGYTLKDDGLDEELIQKAVSLAKTKRKVVIFAGLTDSYETEGYDRSMLDMPLGHNKLIEEVSKVNPDVVVVLQLGSPVIMPWLGSVKAVLNTYLTGEANGDSTYNLLYGKANPSGKLAETFPLNLNDYIGSKYFRMGPTTVEHREGIFVGYRYFDTAKKQVLFPFGYGLSYTEFSYSDFKLSADKIKESDMLKVFFKITNTGKVAGAEIAQIYVSKPESKIFRAEKELKGFEKVFLKPGESKEITISLDSRAFSYYNTGIKAFCVESGAYEIKVASSSRDIKWTGTVNVSGKVKESADLSVNCPAYYNLDKVDVIDDKSFENLLGFAIPENTIPVKGSFNYNSTIQDIKDTGIGKLFMKFGVKAIKSQAKDVDFTTQLVLENTYKEVPIRSFAGFSQGIVNDKLLNAIINFANGKTIRGIFGVIASIPGVIITLLKLKSRERKKRKE